MKYPRLALAVRVALLYIFIGGAWILASDWLADKIVTDSTELSGIQANARLFFVALSGLVIWAYLGRENRLRQRSQQGLSDIFEHAAEGIFQCSIDGKLLSVNSALSRLYGYDSPAEMVSAAANFVGHLYQTESTGQQFINNVIRNGRVERFEARQFRKDGSSIWTSTNARLIGAGSGNPVLIEGLVSDITEQKRGEQVLRDSEVQYRRLVERAPYLVAIYAEERLVYLNQVGASLMGAASPEQLYGSSIVDLFEADSAAGILSQLQTLQDGRAMAPREERLVRQDGSLLEAEVSAYPITHVDGPAVQVVIRDLTEQKKAEEALRTNEERLRAIIDHTQNVYYSYTPQHVLTYVSPQASAVLGISPDELGRSWKDLLTDHPINARGVHLMQRAIDTGVAQEPYVLELKAGGGDHVWVEVRESPVVRDGATVAMVGALTDITARKETDEDLERRLAELTVLHAVALAGSQSQSQDELVTRTTQIICGMLYPDDGGVYLLNEAGDELAPHASYWGADLPDARRPLALWEGIVGLVASSGKLVRVNNVSLEPAYVPGSSGVQSELCVPIRVDGKIIGVLNVESRKLDAFGPKDERVLSTIADTLGSGLQRLRLLITERDRRLEAEHLREATAALTRTIEIDQLYEIILEALATVLPFAGASIGLINEDSSEIVASAGLPRGAEIVTVKAPERAAVGSRRTFEAATPQRRKKAEGGNPQASEPTERPRGWITVPMYVREQLIGYLNLGSDHSASYLDAHAAALQTFANQAAIALHNARLFQEERKRTRIIQALADIANDIATTPDLSGLLDHVAQRALDLLQASHVAVYLVQNDNRTIKPVAVRGTYSEQILSHSIQLGEGITGSIIASGKAEIINDTPGDPRTVRVPGTPRDDGLLETMMSAPLVLRDRAVGAINVWRLRSEGLFNPSELNFLTSIAHQASISIALSRLFQETVRRAEEAAAIAEVGRDISTTLQVEMVLERIATYAKDLLRAETSAVYLYEREDMNLHAVAARGVDADEIKGDPVEIGRGLSGNIALNRRGEIVNYAASDPRALTVKGTESNPLEHFMGVPIINHEELTGLVVVWRTGADQEFRTPELEFLSGLGQQAAVAIENARLFQLERHRRQEAENLQVAATAVTSSLDLEEVLQTILVALKQVIPYDSASMLLLEGEHVRIRAERGLPEPQLALNQTFPASNRLLRAIQISGKPLVLLDAQADARFEHWAASNAVRGWLGVPLIARGKTIGYITLDSYSPDAFNNTDAELAQTFAHQAAAAIDNARLYSGLEQANRELSRAYDTTLEGWGKALELRDKETQGHTRRVADLTVKLAHQLGIRDPELTDLRRGVLVHDIGKMGVPDHILHKRTPLNAKEWAELRRHPQYAFDLLYPIPYLRSALHVAYCHHERWNGSGYPRGLSGEEIPLTARIFAVVDVWDALLSDRSYRKAWPRNRVLHHIRTQSAVLYDPQVVKVFIEMMEKGRPGSKPRGAHQTTRTKRRFPA